jgi:hypothetical protein
LRRDPAHPQADDVRAFQSTSIALVMLRDRLHPTVDIPGRPTTRTHDAITSAYRMLLTGCRSPTMTKQIAPNATLVLKHETIAKLTSISSKAYLAVTVTARPAPAAAEAR